MTIAQLRLKHPRFVYKTYSVGQTSDSVVITYEFLLEPDIVFRPTVTIPYKGDINKEIFGDAVFQLGMIEAISYWKAACPAEFVVEAGELSSEQIRFWQDLFLHGLGEFYFQNKIDFTKEDFLKITTNKTYKATMSDTAYMNKDGKDLVLVGGGKDSAVTLALLKDGQIPYQTMVVNPTPASLENIHAAGLDTPKVVNRAMDSQLYRLNKEGYLNGHTPFSAYLAFLGNAVAALYNSPRVIVSNERSADEGNVMYLGMEINHQYSKSFRFEQMVREYLDVEYFSFLRPLNDVQIAMIFAKHPKFFTTFRSCNAGSKANEWCGKCAKCAFTYLVLYPFMRHEQMLISFGADLFAVPEIISHIIALVGLTPIKPFECVGTRDEAALAVYMSVEKYLKEKREVPEGLLRIKSDLGLSDSEVVQLAHQVIDRWGDVYNVPDEYLSVLKNAWKKVL